MKALHFLTFFISAKTAYAHCDIPCGIYDPNQAQLAAHTVLRMTMLLSDKKDMHDIARITHVKETHGDLVEDALGTLENDYFKPEHFEMFPELKGLIADSVKLSIETRVHVDEQKAREMLEKILKISEIFYKTKNVTPVRVKSVYPTEEEIVTYHS